MMNSPYVFHFSLIDSKKWTPAVFQDGYVEGAYIHSLLSNKVQSLSYKDYGEWINIKINKSFLEVKIDLLGYYRVFYYKSEDNLILSNDFDALVIYLKQNNVFLTPNEVICNLSFNIRDSYFNNLFSEDTFCNEIKILEPGQKIIYNGTYLEIASRDVYDVAYAEVGDYDYEELLERGLQLFSKSLYKLRKEGREINIHLSGGYDSRVCLALLLAFMSPSQIFVTTARPHKGLGVSVRDVIEKDYVIACTICKELNIPFFHKKNEINFRLGYSANFYDLKNFINNNYFSVSMNSKRSLDSFNVVEVRGGAGELLRGSAYLDRLKDELVGTEESLRDDLELLFDSLSKKEQFIGENEKEYFIQENISYPGNTIFEKFDYRFLNARNNRHFGHHRKSYAEGKYTFMPLGNPYFLVASRKLTYSERKTGKLALDIIERTSKQLLSIPFATQINDSNTHNLLTLAESELYHGELVKSDTPAIISAANRDGMNTESLLKDLRYMAKRAEFLQRGNPSLREMFQDIKNDVEKMNRFDHIMHNKLLSFLSIYEPSYMSFKVFKK